MKKCALILILTLLGVPRLQAESQFMVDAQSQLYLQGNSTLYPYSSTATVLNINAKFSQKYKDAQEILTGAKIDAKTGAKAGAKVEKFELSIPVTALKSGESLLDKNMQSSLKATRYPKIIYELKRYTIYPSSGGIFLVAAEGTLTVAGTEKKIELNLSARPDGNRLNLKGSCPLKMTDFAIHPPELMFGMIKTANEIVIRFDITLLINKN